MTYVLGNSYDVKLPGSGMLLTRTGKKFSHEWEDYQENFSVTSFFHER